MLYDLTRHAKLSKKSHPGNLDEMFIWKNFQTVPLPLSDGELLPRGIIAYILLFSLTLNSLKCDTRSVTWASTDNNF